MPFFFVKENVVLLDYYGNLNDNRVSLSQVYATPVSSNIGVQYRKLQLH